MTRSRVVASSQRLVRDTATLLLYAVLGVVGFLLNGLGAILGPLRRELEVDRAQVAFYPSLFAAALIVMGLIGGGAVERMGHRTAMVLSLGGMSLGACMLALPERPLTLVGAALLGTGSAISIQVVPSALTRRHPHAAAPAIGEANAVSSTASFVAPAAVAGAIALGVGWRVGYLLPSVPVAVVLIALLSLHLRLRASLADSAPGRTTDADGAEVPLPPRGPGYEPGPLLGRWLDVVMAVSAEFCLVFWAADAFQEWHGAGAAAAPALATLFLLGMALVRIMAARLTTGQHPSTVVMRACGVTLLGFLGFWVFPGLVGSAVGLFLAGAGLALLYPITVARLVAAWPDAQDRASARGALASGLAIGVAPFVLAKLADEVGLRAAYLIVPGLLLTLGAHAVVTRACSANTSVA